MKEPSLPVFHAQEPLELEASQARRRPDGEGLTGPELLTSRTDRHGLQGLEHVPSRGRIFPEQADDAFEAVDVKRCVPEHLRFIDRVQEPQSPDLRAKTNKGGKHPLVKRRGSALAVMLGRPEVKPSGPEDDLGFHVQLLNVLRPQKGLGHFKLLLGGTLSQQAVRRSPASFVAFIAILVGFNGDVLHPVAEVGTQRQRAKQRQSMGTVDADAVGVPTDNNVLVQNMADHVVQHAVCLGQGDQSLEIPLGRRGNRRTDWDRLIPEGESLCPFPLFLHLSQLPLCETGGETHGRHSLVVELGRGVACVVWVHERGALRVHVPPVLQLVFGHFLDLVLDDDVPDVGVEEVGLGRGLGGGHCGGHGCEESGRSGEVSSG